MMSGSAGSDRLSDALPPPPSQLQQNNCRLWIGNLDQKITEYAMLKLLQKFKNVTLQQFDFIYHRNGPEKGRSRGYCFVTLGSPHEAATVLHGLNGKLALSRRLVVKYAEVEKRDASSSSGIAPSTPADNAETKKSDICVEGKIQAIEAKLQMMEENKDGGTPPVILYPPPANLKRQQELATEAAESSKRRNRSEYQYRRPRHQRPYKSRRGR